MSKKNETTTAAAAVLQDPDDRQMILQAVMHENTLGIGDHDEGWPFLDIRWSVEVSEEEEAHRIAEIERLTALERKGGRHVTVVEYLGWAAGINQGTLCGVFHGPINPALVARHTELADYLNGETDKIDCDDCRQRAEEAREIAERVAENEREAALDDEPVQEGLLA